MALLRNLFSDRGCWKTTKVSSGKGPGAQE
jgi:hypothetical protein